jgi:hypothetical protein
MIYKCLCSDSRFIKNIVYQNIVYQAAISFLRKQNKLVPECYWPTNKKEAIV